MLSLYSIISFYLYISFLPYITSNQLTYEDVPVIWEVVSSNNQFQTIDAGVDNTLLAQLQSKDSILYEVPNMKVLKIIPACEYYTFLKSRDEIYCIGEQKKIYELVNDQWVLKWDDAFKHAAADHTHDLIVTCKENNQIWQMNTQTGVQKQYGGACYMITSGNVDDQLFVRGSDNHGHYYSKAQDTFLPVGGNIYDITTAKDIGYAAGIGFTYNLWTINAKDNKWRGFSGSIRDISMTSNGLVYGIGRNEYNLQRFKIQTIEYSQNSAYGQYVIAKNNGETYQFGRFLALNNGDQYGYVDKGNDRVCVDNNDDVIELQSNNNGSNCKWRFERVTYNKFAFQNEKDGKFARFEGGKLIVKVTSWVEEDLWILQQIKSS